MAYTIKDICTPRKGKDGKTFWHRVGTAFVGDDGKIGGTLDSLPLPDADGRVSFQFFDRRDAAGADDRRKPHPAKGIAEGRRAAADLNDDIPF